MIKDILLTMALLCALILLVQFWYASMAIIAIIVTYFISKGVNKLKKELIDE